MAKWAEAKAFQKKTPADRSAGVFSFTRSGQFEASWIGLSLSLPDRSITITEYPSARS
jgi:hypothetical protein